MGIKNKTCEECDFYGKGTSIHQTSMCKKHAPVVMPNPNYSKGDSQFAVTMWPNALGPCGDFED